LHITLKIEGQVCGREAGVLILYILIQHSAGNIEFNVVYIVELFGTEE